MSEGLGSLNELHLNFGTIDLKFSLQAQSLWSLCGSLIIPTPISVKLIKAAVTGFTWVCFQAEGRAPHKFVEVDFLEVSVDPCFKFSNP